MNVVKFENGPHAVNKLVVNDQAAPPLRIEFYSIETNAPVLADQDGVPKPPAS
jgi:hypothetical protein